MFPETCPELQCDLGLMRLGQSLGATEQIPTLQTVVYGTELIASLIVGSNTVRAQQDRPLSLITKDIQVFGNLQLRTLENGAAIIA